MVATQQSFSVSRRTLDVEDYIDIGRRHAAWVVGLAFAGTVLVTVISLLLPNTYTSKAVMQITPAQISENMVPSTITSQLNDRITQMQTEILSRSNLSAMISDPHLLLYQDDLKTSKSLEDVIDDMRKDINIGISTVPGSQGRTASAFTISFNYSNRYKAQLTVQALMNKFTEQNLNTQKSQQDQLKDYVHDALDTARADLSKANDQLTAFRQGNAGKLPEQAQVNIAQSNALNGKIQTDSEQIFRYQQSLAALQDRKSQDQARLELLDTEEAQANAGIPGSPVAQQNQDLASLDKNIETLKFQLEGLRRNFSDKYPPVKRAQDQLDLYQKKRDQLAQQIQAKAAADAAKPTDPVRKTTDPRMAERRLAITQDMQQVDTQMKILNQDIDRLTKEQEGYKRESDAATMKLREGVGLEAKYAELENAQKMAQQNMQDLMGKQKLTEASSQLISRGAGESLSVLDVASLPTDPVKPKRPLIIGAGAGVSIILGFGMAFLQEAKDTSLKNLKDVRAYTNLPVLCSIPLLENTILVKRKRRLTYLAWSAAVIVGAAAVASAVVYYETVTMKT